MKPMREFAGLVELGQSRIPINEFKDLELRFKSLRRDSSQFKSGRYSFMMQSGGGVASCDLLMRPQDAAPGLFALTTTHIDNTEELRADLTSRPNVHSQSEDIILESYRKWGMSFCEKLYGDFSIAIIDENCRRVILARDHVGTKPLFFRWFGTRLAFASNISLLKPFAPDEWQLDFEKVRQFIHAPERFFSNILFQGLQEIAPGHYLSATSPTVQSQTRWWDPRNYIKDSRLEPQEFLTDFREELELSVRRSVGTEHVVATHLSGGIDSSAITLLAKDAAKESSSDFRYAFSWSPEIGAADPLLKGHDERQTVLDICDTCELEPIFSTVNDDDIFQFLQLEIEDFGTVDLFDEPQMLARANRLGVTRILSGWGGDEAYSSHSYEFLSYCLLRLDFAKARKVLSWITRSDKSLKSISGSFFNWGLLPLLPDPVYLAYSPFRVKYPNSCFSIRTEANAFEGRYRASLLNTRPTYDPKEYTCRLLRNGHLATRMEAWSMQSSEIGISYRYPLLDRRLLECYLSMPRDLYFSDGKSRYLARAVVKDVLPTTVNKIDIANIHRRNRVILAFWNKLKGYFSDDYFSDGFGIVDVAPLQNAINGPPHELRSDTTIVFYEILTALRTLALLKRNN
jgi:asparagine synthase (glutamine-hydrolysing)